MTTKGSLSPALQLLGGGHGVCGGPRVAGGTRPWGSETATPALVLSETTAGLNKWLAGIFCQPRKNIV